MNNDKEWLLKKAEQEDGVIVSVGGLIGSLTESAKARINRRIAESLGWKRMMTTAGEYWHEPRCAAANDLAETTCVAEHHLIGFQPFLCDSHPPNFFSDKAAAFSMLEMLPEDTVIHWKGIGMEDEV